MCHDHVPVSLAFTASTTHHIPSPTPPCPAHSLSPSRPLSISLPPAHSLSPFRPLTVFLQPTHCLPFTHSLSLSSPITVSFLPTHYLPLTHSHPPSHPLTPSLSPITLPFPLTSSLCFAPTLHPPTHIVPLFLPLTTCSPHSHCAKIQIVHNFFVMANHLVVSNHRWRSG